MARSPHHYICTACGQRKPYDGFRGGLCAECCKRDLARFDAGRLVNAVHLMLKWVPKDCVSKVSDALSEPGFDVQGSAQ